MFLKMLIWIAKKHLLSEKFNRFKIYTSKKEHYAPFLIDVVCDQSYVVLASSCLGGARFLRFFASSSFLSLAISASSSSER